MERFKEYFIRAWQKAIEGKPWGFQTKITMKAGVGTTIASDMTRGRSAGSEENRRALAKALGWEYEEFLKYGKSLVEGYAYQPPQPQTPAYDPEYYLAVPFFTKITRMPVPGGYQYSPDLSEKNQPVMILKSWLERGYRDAPNFAAFKMPDGSMSPTIPDEGIVIVDLDDRAIIDQHMYGVAASSTNGSFTVKIIPDV